MSPAQLRRFFTKADRRLSDRKSIRDLCIFARQNVIKDPPFSKLDLDQLPQCAHLFRAGAAKETHPGFPLRAEAARLAAARQRGNASARFGDLFSAVDAKNKIFLKRPDARRPLPHLRSRRTIFPRRDGSATSASERTAEVWSRLDVLKEADRLLGGEYCPPGLVVNDDMEIIQFRGEVAPYLESGLGRGEPESFQNDAPGVCHRAAERDRRGAQSRRAGAQASCCICELRGEPREVRLDVLRIDPPAVQGARFRRAIFEEVRREPAPAAKAGRGGAKTTRGDAAGRRTRGGAASICNRSSRSTRRRTRSCARRTRKSSRATRNCKAPTRNSKRRRKSCNRRMRN